MSSQQKAHELFAGLGVEILVIGVFNQ